MTGLALTGVHVHQVANKQEPAIRLQTAKVEFWLRPLYNPALTFRPVLLIVGRVAHGACVRQMGQK